VTIGDTFGETPDGEVVRRVRLTCGDLTAHVIEWGAVVQDLRLDGHTPPLVLGFARFEDYPRHSQYFGAIAGRCANRIANASFGLDGRNCEVDRNFLGKHHLHGGAKGFGKRLWSFVDHGPDFVTLELVSEDGDMGYPGRLTARCTYRLTQENALAVELGAETDSPTLCNLAQHSYFNLDDGGATPILEHEIEIEAESYLPVDHELIPTGEVRSVAGTDFDFRTMRPIRHERGREQVLYDHNFCLSKERVGVRRISSVTGARSGISLEVHATEPGVQFYAGQKVSVPVPGLDGIVYGAWSGLCLEPQVWPDAANHPGFPSAVLRPGERYRQVTEYRFEQR
jgi:aldose 1-epimerase